MSASVIAWDIETIPDLKRRRNGHAGESDDEIRAGC